MGRPSDSGYSIVRERGIAVISKPPAAAGGDGDPAGGHPLQGQSSMGYGGKSEAPGASRKLPERSREPAPAGGPPFGGRRPSPPGARPEKPTGETVLGCASAYCW